MLNAATQVFHNVDLLRYILSFRPLPRRPKPRFSCYTKLQGLVFMLLVRFLPVHLPYH